jgi:predicted dehydrogenase
MTNHDAIGYGLIGCGGFGQFCLGQYQTLSTIRPIAVADVNPDLASMVAQRFGMRAEESVDALLADPLIQFVHIATPPTTHRDLSIRAIEAGKHVLCEKPLAIRLSDAGQMIDAATANNRLLAANLIMRYNPLCAAVRQIVEQELLGKPLHGFFENYAKDEQLGPAHWFWKPEHSGGIFIEHGVHFFDLYEWWLGSGEVVSAHQVGRPGAEHIVEQVQCTVRYRDGMLVNFYHGFTQAERMDRQEMRIVFERGVLRLFEWVPTSLEIDAILPVEDRDRVLEILGHGESETLDGFFGDERGVYSRHKKYQVDGRYRITAGVGMDKPALYGHVLRGLLGDQIAALHHREHHRRITEQNGYDSLAMAVRAREIAEQQRCRS